jgi:hypothetical protein
MGHETTVEWNDGGYKGGLEEPQPTKVCTVRSPLIRYARDMMRAPTLRGLRGPNFGTESD